jgi:hypothetical protein
MADDALLEAVRGDFGWRNRSSTAHPELGPKPLLVKLREYCGSSSQAWARAPRRSVREALTNGADRR